MVPIGGLSEYAKSGLPTAAKGIHPTNVTVRLLLGAIIYTSL